MDEIRQLRQSEWNLSETEISRNIQLSTENPVKSFRNDRKDTDPFMHPPTVPLSVLPEETRDLPDGKVSMVNIPVLNWISRNEVQQSDIPQNIPKDVPIFRKSADANNRRSPCKFCNTHHEKVKDACPAFKKRCHKCGKENHFAAVCKLKTAKSSKIYQNVQSFKPAEHTNLDDALSMKRSKSESDLINRNKKRSTSVPTPITDYEASCKPEWLKNQRKRRKDEVNIEPMPNCLWCSNPTRWKCKDCHWSYCSKRCSYQDPSHSGNCTFCLLCSDKEGCYIHGIRNSNS